MMSEPLESSLVCAGCDLAVGDEQLLSFACSAGGDDDIDHVLRAHIPTASVQASWLQDDTRNTFLRYRRLSHTWRLAMRQGMSDETYVGIVEKLEAAINALDGSDFSTSPLEHSSELAVSIKNETGSVSGSHKARHLIGTAIHLEVAKHLGAPIHDATLAIASCGNAALAAAVVARASNRKLQVFVPPWAEPSTLDRLHALGAEPLVCERHDGDAPGDPCYHRFRQAVLAGALPFSCQGGDNALAIIGGHTLGWELVESARQSPHSWQHLVIQVGGGALASSIIQTFLLAGRSGLLRSLPRFHLVQTESASPLVRAWQMFRDSGLTTSQARCHRSQFMWPWETEPKSIASGILDDETYDWFAIVEGLEATDGSALCVSEERLRRAQELALEKTGIQVSVTGASGLAGLLELRAQGTITEAQHSVVLFTGVIR